METAPHSDACYDLTYQYKLSMYDCVTYAYNPGSTGQEMVDHFGAIDIDIKEIVERKESGENKTIIGCAVELTIFIYVIFRYYINGTKNQRKQNTKHTLDLHAYRTHHFSKLLYISP